MALLEACRLSKRFGGLQAFQDVDLTIAEGEIVGLIGPNGSGKTTFFNAVTGLYPATGGRILFADGRHDLTRLPPHRITALGVARTFQNQRCFNQMTVLENVLVGTHCRTRSGLASIVAGTPGARAEQRRVRAEALELLAFFRERLAPRAAGGGRFALVRQSATARDRARARHATAPPAPRRAGSRHEPVGDPGADG